MLNVIEIKGNWYGVIPAKGWIYKKYVEHKSLGEDDKVADEGETEEGDDAGFEVKSAAGAAKFGDVKVDLSKLKSWESKRTIELS